MAGSDFYVSFDSNSDLFLEKIKRDLGAADAVIKGFDARMQSMHGFAQGLTAQMQALEKAGIKVDVNYHTSGGGGGAGGGGHDDVRRIDASIDRFTLSLGKFEGFLDHLPRKIEEAARKSVAAHSQNRDPGTQRFLPEEPSPSRPATTGAARRRQQEQVARAAERAGITSAPTTTVVAAAPAIPQNIPHVSEAALEGLKGAIGEGTKATKNVRRSVDEVKTAITALREALLARPPGGAAPTVAGGGAAPARAAAAAAGATPAAAHIAAAPAAASTVPQIVGATGVSTKVAKLRADIAALTALATRAMQPGGDVESLAGIQADLEKLQARLTKAEKTPAERRKARGEAREVSRRSALKTPTPSIDFVNISAAMDIASERAAGIDSPFRGALLQRKGSKGAAEDPWGTLRAMITSFQKAGVDPGQALSADLQKKWKQVFDTATGQFKDERVTKGQGNTKENLMAIVEGLGRLVNAKGLPTDAGMDAAQKELAKRVTQYKKETATVLPQSMQDLVKALGTGEMTADQKAAFDVLDRNARRGGSSRRGVSALQVERPAHAVAATKVRDEFEAAGKEAEAARQALSAVKAQKRKPDEKEQAALAQAEKQLADVLQRERQFRTKELGVELAAAREQLAQVKKAIDTATGPAAADVEAANKRYADAINRRTKAAEAQERIGLVRQDQRYVAQAAGTVGRFLDDTVKRALTVGKQHMATGSRDVNDPAVNPYQRVLGDDENALAANRALAKMRSVYNFLDKYAELMLEAERLQVKAAQHEVGSKKRTRLEAEAEGMRQMAAPYRVEGVNEDWTNANMRPVLQARAQGRAEFAARHDEVQKSRERRQALMGGIQSLFLQPLGYQGAARQPMSSAMPGLRLASTGRLELRDEFAPLIKSAAERNAAEKAARYGTTASPKDVSKAERQLTAPLNKAAANLASFIDTGKEPKLPEKLVEALTKFTGVAQKMAAGQGLHADEEALVKSLQRITGLNARQAVREQGPLAASEQVQRSVKMRHLESEIFAQYDKLFGTAGGIGIRRPGELGFLSPTTTETVGGHRMLLAAPAMSEQRRQAVKDQEKVLRERANEELKRRRSLGLENPRTLAELETVKKEALTAPLTGQQPVTGAAAVSRMSERLREFGVIFDKKINPTLLAASLKGVDELYAEFNRLRGTGELVVSAIRDDMNRAARQPKREAGIVTSSQAVEQQAATRATDPRADYERRRQALLARQRAATLATTVPIEQPSEFLRQARASRAKLQRLGGVEGSVPELVRGRSEAAADQRKNEARRQLAVDEMQRKIDADEARIAAMPENKNKRARRSAERGLQQKRSVMTRLLADLEWSKKEYARREAQMQKYLDNYFSTLDEAKFYTELAKMEGAKDRRPQTAPQRPGFNLGPGPELGRLETRASVAKSRLIRTKAVAGVEKDRLYGHGGEDVTGATKVSDKAKADLAAARAAAPGTAEAGEKRVASALKNYADVLERRMRMVERQRAAEAELPRIKELSKAADEDLAAYRKKYSTGAPAPELKPGTEAYKKHHEALRQTPEYQLAQQQARDERLALDAQRQQSRTVHGPTTIGTLNEAKAAQQKYKEGLAETQKVEEKAAAETKKSAAATRDKAKASDQAAKATKEENKALAELLRNAKVATTGETWKAATGARAAGKTDAEIIAAAKAAAAVPAQAPSVAKQARLDVTAANKEVRAAKKELTAAEEAKDAARLSAAQKRLTAATEKQVQAKEREAALPKGDERERARLQGLEVDALKRSVAASQKRLAGMGITDLAGERASIEASLKALPTPSRDVKLTAEQAAERKRLNTRLHAINQVQLGQAVAAERGIDLSVAPAPRVRVPRAPAGGAPPAGPTAPAPARGGGARGGGGGGAAATGNAALNALGRKLDSDDDVAAIDKVTAAVNKVYALLRQGIRTTNAGAAPARAGTVAPAAGAVELTPAQKAAQTRAQNKARADVEAANKALAAAEGERDAARAAIGRSPATAAAGMNRLVDRGLRVQTHILDQEMRGRKTPGSTALTTLEEVYTAQAEKMKPANQQKRLDAAMTRYTAALDAVAKAKEREAALGGAATRPAAATAAQTAAAAQAAAAQAQAAQAAQAAHAAALQKARDAVTAANQGLGTARAQVTSAQAAVPSQKDVLLTKVLEKLIASYAGPGLYGRLHAREAAENQPRADLVQRARVILHDELSKSGRNLAAPARVEAAEAVVAKLQSGVGVEEERKRHAAAEKQAAAALKHYADALERAAQAKEKEAALAAAAPRAVAPPAGGGKPPKPPATAAAGMGEPGWHEGLGRIDDSAKKKSAIRQPALTPVVREDLIRGLEKVKQGLSDQAREAIKLKSTDQALAISVDAVASGMVNAKNAARLFADEMKLTSQEARALERDIRRQVESQKALEQQRAPVETAHAAALRENARRVAAAATARQRADSARTLAAGRLGGLSPETIAEARRIGLEMGRSLVPQEQVIKDLHALFAKVDQELRAQHPGEKVTKGSVKAKFSDLATAGGIDLPGKEITNLSRTLVESNKAEARQAGRQVGGFFGASLAEGAQNDVARAMFGSHGFWSRVIGSAGLFVVRNFAAGAVFGITNQIQEIISQSMQAESTFVRVSSALEATGRSAGGLRTELLRTSTDYGVALADVYETAAGLAGVFEGVGEVATATRVVTQLQMISNGALSAKEGMGALASTASAFGLYTTDALTHVADVLTVIQNNLGTNIEVTAEGLGAFAGQAVAMNIPLEDAAVYVAQIAKMTNATGAAAGEQFGRILATMQGGRGIAALTEAFPGPKMADALATRQYGDALQILVGGYGDLDDAQQRYIATVLFGTRQARAGQALLLDGDKVLNTITKSTNAYGEAEKRAAEISEQFLNQIARLKTGLQNIGEQLIRLGLLDAAGAVFKVFAVVLQDVGTALSLIGDFFDKHPLANHMLHLTMTVLGLGVGLKLLRSSLLGVAAAMGTMNRFVLGRAGLVGTVQAAAAAPAAAAAAAAAAAGGAAAAGAAAPVMVPGRYQQRLQQRVIAAQTGTSIRAAARSAEFLAWQASAGVVRPTPITSQAAAAAQARAAQAAAARSAILAEHGREAPAGPVRSLERMERNATRMAGALNKASTAMASVSANSGKLQAGLIAVMIAVMAAMEANRMHKETEEALEDHYKKTLAGRGKTEEEIAATDEDLRNPMAARLEKIREPGNWLMAGMAVNAIGKSLWSLLPGGPKPGDVIPDVTSGRMAQRDLGILPEKDVQGLKADWAQTEADATSLLSESLVGFFDTVPDLTNEEVKKRSKEFQDRIDAKRKKVADDPTLSAEQKTAYEAEFTAMENWWNDAVRNLIEQRDGIKLLTSEQLKELQQLTSNLGSMDAIFMTQSSVVQDALKGMAGESGLEGPALERLMAAASMKGGKQAQLTNLADAAEGLLDDAARNLIAAQASGDEQKINDAQAAFWGASQNAASTAQALLGYITAQGQAAAQLAAFTGDFSGAAGALGTAASALRDKAAEYDAANDPGAAVAARAQAQALDQQAAQQLITQDSLSLNLSRSSTRNTAELARLEVQLAQVQANHAVGVEAQNAAQVRLNQANLALTDVYIAQGAAARMTAAARVPPGNALAVARMAKRNANLAKADAAIYGTASTQYQTALQQSIQAGWSIVQAERAMTEARISLAQARATAAGDIVKAAEIGVKLAKAQLATAKKMSGGKNSAEVLAARAGLVNAQAALRDTRLQNELDTIDFNKEMGTITGEEAIKALQAMLKATNLTEAQRRDIMRKIKGLQDDIRSQLTGSGFNIPSEIKMPTAYEVRRSLGADAAREAIGQSVMDVRSQQGGVVGGTDGSLVSAMQAVRDAVLANGAQNVTQNVDIVNQVPTAAIAKALVTQVIEELRRQSSIASRSNTSTPRSVP